MNGCHKNHLIFSDDLMLDQGKFALFTLHTHRHTHLRLLYNKDSLCTIGEIYLLVLFGRIAFFFALQVFLIPFKATFPLLYCTLYIICNPYLSQRYIMFFLWKSYCDKFSGRNIINRILFVKQMPRSARGTVINLDNYPC